MARRLRVCVDDEGQIESSEEREVFEFQILFRTPQSHDLLMKGENFELASFSLTAKPTNFPFHPSVPPFPINEQLRGCCLPG